MTSDAFGVVFAIALIAGIVGWAAWSTARAHKRAAERLAASTAYAAHREWEFRATDPALVGRFPGAPFDQGFNRVARNVFTGRHDGRDFVAFDHEFDTRSGGKNNSTQHHFYSVVALDLGLPTPGMAVGPTSSFGWLVNALTGRDVEIGHPLYDQTFTVTSPSPEFAKDVLHPDVVEVVLQHPQLAWRLVDTSLLVVREGQHSSQEIEAKLHFMDAVLDRIPQRVRDRLLGEPPR